MLSERTNSFIMGIRRKNLNTLLILTFFELQTVFAHPDDQFLALLEEQLPAFPDE